MKILVCMPVTDEHKQWLTQTAGSDTLEFCPAGGVTEENISDAEIVIGNPPVEMLKYAKKMRLLQLNSAGTGRYPEIMPEICPQATLCCATGTYGLAISEHMLGALLMLMKNLAFYRDNQYAGRWERLTYVDSIEGSKTLVIGMGDIGSSFARRMHLLGSTVTGIRRTAGEKPDYCEAVYTTDMLDECLPKADVIALSMPETPETIGMMDARRFALVKNGAYIINVGRGSAIDQDALLEALHSGHISGAALDVMTPEPLPADHPLWKEPRCLITPHVSGGFALPATHSKIIRLACRNIEAYRCGRPLESQVDFKTGYAAKR